MQIFAVFPVLIIIATVILHLALSWAVLSDANRLRSETHTETIFLTPGFWWLAVLLGGLPAAGIYWAMHHSTLRPAMSMQR